MCDGLTVGLTSRGERGELSVGVCASKKLNITCQGIISFPRILSGLSKYQDLSGM